MKALFATIFSALIISCAFAQTPQETDNENTLSETNATMASETLPQDQTLSDSTATDTQIVSEEPAEKTLSISEISTTSSMISSDAVAEADNGSIINPIACFACHKEQFADWETSLHAKSHEDLNPLYEKAITLVSSQTRQIREQVLLSCGTCHNPKLEKKFVSESAALAIMLDIDSTVKNELKNALEAEHIKSGISCYICHNVDSINHRDNYTTVGYQMLNWTKGNLIVGPYDLSSQQTIFHSFGKRDFFRENNDLCLSCHQGQATKNELSMYNTGEELNSSGTDDKCVDCHMGSIKKGILAPQIKRDNMVERDIKSHFFAGARNSDILKDIIDINMEKTASNTAKIIVSNSITHGVPSGFSGRSLVLELLFLNGDEVIRTETIDFRATYESKFGSETLSYAAKALLSDTRLKPKENREIHIRIPNETNSIKTTLSYYILAPQLQEILKIDDKTYTKPYEVISKEFKVN